MNFLVGAALVAALVDVPVFARATTSENSQLGGLVRPCFVFDFVFAPGTGGPGVNSYFWAAGTSMAAPHVAGPATQLIGGNSLKVWPPT